MLKAASVDQIEVRGQFVILASKMKDRPSVMDLPDLPKGELPAHLELQRTRVVCAADAPSYVRVFDLPCDLLLLVLSNRYCILCRNLSARCFGTNFGFLSLGKWSAD